MYPIMTNLINIWLKKKVLVQCSIKERAPTFPMITPNSNLKSKVGPLNLATDFSVIYLIKNKVNYKLHILHFPNRKQQSMIYYAKGVCFLTIDHTLLGLYSVHTDQPQPRLNQAGRFTIHINCFSTQDSKQNLR